MLYPLCMVDRNDEGEDATSVLAKANIVTDTYFACDCRNCRDTVLDQDRGEYPCKLDNCHSKCKTQFYLQRFCEASEVVRNCLVVNSSGTHD